MPGTVDVSYFADRLVNCQGLSPDAPLNVIALPLLEVGRGGKAGSHVTAGETESSREKQFTQGSWQSWIWKLDLSDPDPLGSLKSFLLGLAPPGV